MLLKLPNLKLPARSLYLNKNYSVVLFKFRDEFSKNQVASRRPSKNIVRSDQVTAYMYVSPCFNFNYGYDLISGDINMYKRFIEQAWCFRRWWNDSEPGIWSVRQRCNNMRE